MPRWSRLEIDEAFDRYQAAALKGAQQRMQAKQKQSSTKT